MLGSIFRKLLGASIVVIAVTLAGLDWYLSRYMAQQHLEQVTRRLAAEGTILAGEVAGVPAAGLETWAQTAGPRAGARVTVIDNTGRVLADSAHDPETMENHGNRPEVRQAIAGKLGSAVRHSATLDRDLSYVAVPLDYEQRPAVVRLALPVEELDSAIAALRQRLLIASLLAACAALLLAWFLSRAFTRRIDRLRLMAERLPDVSFPEGRIIDADDELGALERSFRAMSAHVRGLLDRLQLESARREAILVSMVEGLLAVDADLKVIFYNRAFARAVGAPDSTPGHMPVTQFVRDPDLLAALTQTVTSPGTYKRRLELRAENTRSYEVQTAPLDGAPRPGAIMILHDITDLERLERVRKDFVANVSHELRTPLAAIRGYAETLLDGALEDHENNRRFVEVIHAQATRLNNVAADLLALSDLESGKVAPAPQRIPVRTIIETAILTVEAEARVRGVNLRAGVIEDCDILGQRMRLEQALVNLIDNAVKFNRSGGEVTVDALRQGDGRIRIVVADNGIGIPSEDLPRIFERFYRVDKARSRAVGGTGLGLSIVRHAVESAGGSVSVESQLGAGSKFTVILPTDELTHADSNK